MMPNKKRYRALLFMVVFGLAIASGSVILMVSMYKARVCTSHGGYYKLLTGACYFNA
jgi:hypothetical protein